MGAFQSTKGIKNAIIGDENIAKFPLPEKDDSRWQTAGEVSQLYIYPVKSFCGTSVEKARIEKLYAKKLNIVLKKISSSNINKLIISISLLPNVIQG